MTDPAKFSKQEREKDTKEQAASKKLEENLKKDDADGKPKGPEDAKKEQSQEDPY